MIPINIVGYDLVEYRDQCYVKSWKYWYNFQALTDAITKYNSRRHPLQVLNTTSTIINLRLAIVNNRVSIIGDTNRQLYSLWDRNTKSPYDALKCQFGWMTRKTSLTKIKKLTNAQEYCCVGKLSINGFIVNLNR